MVNQETQITAVFAALADPTRRRILDRLSKQGGNRVTALAKPFRMSLPAISRHLRVLEKARLVKRERAGREHIIRANAAGLKPAHKWIAIHLSFWEDGFDALDKFLKTEQRKEEN